MNFYSQLISIKDRPGIWIGDLTLNNMKRFLDGITFCMKNNNIHDDFVIIFEKYFNWYVNYELLGYSNSTKLKTKLMKNNSRSYCKLIPIIEKNSIEQINIFVDLFESFHLKYTNGFNFQILKDHFTSDSLA